MAPTNGSIIVLKTNPLNGSEERVWRLTASSDLGLIPFRGFKSSGFGKNSINISNILLIPIFLVALPRRIGINSPFLIPCWSP